MGSSKTQNILLNSQVLNCCDGLSQSTNSARDSNDDNCNKIQPFECELQVGTSSEKKQDWSFTLYDFDGNGKITKEELGNLFQALYDAVGSSIRLPLNGTKKLKLRLSIGHDNSHLDPTFKDQSPPLVKKKAKLKNSNGLTEWKEINLQTGTGGGHGVGMVDPKECTKLNNLDASPRAKPSALSKMENQLTSATPGIGHRLMLSCREQRKLTEMVHENMVRNQVRQQTGRKHHHSGHRHHHHHREARRHRGTRRQGDENRKPREKERTYYLDLGVIERSAPHNSVSLPYSAGVPTTTSMTTTTLTTSVMSFARPTIINIVPSSSPPHPPPPPPPPTASGSTAYCNEIGMAADDDDDGDDVVRPEAGGNGSRRKYDNTWRETGLAEPATGHGCLTTTASGQQDHHHHHHHPHHHHHHHRRRHHPHRNSGDGGHAKCKHCNEKCAPINIEAVKANMNGATESENANKTEKKEILNRRHKHSNNCNTNVNYNNNNNNNNDNCNEINNNNNNNSVKNIRDANRELELVSGGDMTKQDNPPPTYKCHNSDANLKASLDCICSRCQKMSCRVSVNYTGSWQAKGENLHDLRQRNAIASADGQETTAGISTLTSAATITTTTTTTAAAASSQCEKKTSDRSSKRTGEERHKKHSQGHHHAHTGRTLSQDRGGQSGPAVAAPVSSSVSAVASKMTAPGRTPGAVAERKSLRTYHKTDSSPQQTSSRHRAHCQNTLVPEKHAGALPSALLPPPVSPPTPDPTPTAAVATTTSTTTATTATTTTTLQQQQQQPHHHHHHHHHLRRRNQTIRNMEFNETMQQVAEWINREHNPQQKGQAQSHQGSVNAEHFVHVQRHEHHHVHEYHHHHHYHHYYQT